MTNEEIRRMMALVDEQYIDELTENVPVSLHEGINDAPADEVSGETPIVKRSPWHAVAAIAAAVVLLLPCAWFVYHSVTGLHPGQQVTEPTSPESASAMTELTEPETETVIAEEPSQDTAVEDAMQMLFDANGEDRPWRNEIPTPSQIGDLVLTHVQPTQSTTLDLSETYDALWIVYGAPEDPEHHRLELTYTLIPLPEELQSYAIYYSDLNADLIGTERLPDPAQNNGDCEFLIDRLTYLIHIRMQGVSTDELRLLVEQLRDCFPPISSDVLLEASDARTITYEEAKSIADSYIPDKVMGYEDSEYPSIMTLDEENILHVTENTRNESGFLVTCDYLSLTYRGNGHSLTFRIGECGFVPADKIPPIDSWSMKCVVSDHTSVVIEDRLREFSFCCTNGEMTVLVQGKATIDEIDAFAQFYGNVWVGGSYNAPTVYLKHPSEVNEPDTPWKGKVPDVGEIGNYQYYYGQMLRYTEESADHTTVHQIIRENLYYYPQWNKCYATDTEHRFTLSYTNQTPEEMKFTDKLISLQELDAQTICTEDRFLNTQGAEGEQEEFRSFVVDLGDYRIVLGATSNIEQEDMQAIIDAILAAQES